MYIINLTFFIGLNFLTDLKLGFIKLESYNLSFFLISNVKNFMYNVNKIISHVKNGLFWTLPKKEPKTRVLLGVPKTAIFGTFLQIFKVLLFFL
jgi:hypothetical protein